MASSFTWMDHSEEERRSMLDVLRLFEEQGTRDELGIAVLRDMYANTLFPGTSIIQTRARYFLFVPWQMQMVEDYLRRNGRRSLRRIQDYAREEEIRLINALALSEDHGGVIGIEAREGLKRLPSNVYWQGLAAWGIRLFSGSQPQYYQALAQSGPPARRRSSEEEDIQEGLTWHPHLPQRPGDFPRNATFHLGRDEARYLHDRIMATNKDSLLAWLLDREDVDLEAPFPWESAAVRELPAAIHSELVHARCFAELIHGAMLLYNHMLATEARIEELIALYEEDLASWEEDLQANPHLTSWTPEAFWANAEGHMVPIPFRTKKFASEWFELVLQAKHPSQLAETPSARELVRQRERSLKGPKARLGNPRRLELWGGASFAARLNYRWPVVKDLLRDIRQGLEESDAPAQ